jgi:hypothetical protein
MLQAIEDEIMISPDGRLPEVFRPMFGHKAQVIVLNRIGNYDRTGSVRATDGVRRNSRLADPLEWQRQQRREMDR